MPTGWSTPPAGVLIYNGFWFPEACQTRGQITPVYDSTGRVVKYSRVTIRVEVILFAGCDDRPGTDIYPLGGTYSPFFPEPLTTPEGYRTPIDDGVAVLRSKLSQAGAILCYRDKGIGADFVVSGTAGLTTHLDVEFGPKPAVLAWEPIAGNKAIRLVWEVETHLADCGGGIHAGGADAGRITEASWSRSYSIDTYGLTTRTAQGEIEIAGTRNGSQTAYTADRWRERFAVPLLDGFQRISQDYTISPDNRRMAFSVVDREHPSDNPLYPGVVDCDVDYTVESAGNAKVLVGQEWRCSLVGSISVAKNQPRWKAWVAFLQVVKSKLEAAYSHAKTTGNPNESASANPQGVKKNPVILRTLSITEQVFGRGMSFNLSWTMFTEIGSLFEASGMWVPLSGSSWGMYRVAMTQGATPAWGPRGVAGLKARPDVVISLCDSVPPLTAESRANTSNSGSDNSLFETKCPPPEESWISFDAGAELIEYSGRVSHYPLTGRALNPTQSYTRALTGSGLSEQSAQQTPPILQTRSQPYYRVRFYGTAARLGHAIPLPRLQEYGGQKAQPVGEAKFKQKHFKKTARCWLYVAAWQQEYILSGPPKGDLLVTNPDPKDFPK